jgi:hypothetical protein
MYFPAIEIYISVFVIKRAKLMSNFQQSGVDIHYGTPLWFENARENVGRLTGNIDSYSHELRAVGGYWSASMSIQDSQINIEEWIEDGIGRHISVYNPSGQVVWEGFVNEISVNLGNLNQFSIGPLISSEFANRVYASYSRIDPTIVPESAGTRVNTLRQNDEISQARYGIIERAISVPNTTDALADQAVTIFLKEHAYPSVSGQSSLSGDQSPTVSLSCLGYWHFLETYIYTVISPSGSSGLQNLSDKIQDVLDAELNGIFSRENTNISTNTSQVKEVDEDERTALDVIKELLQLGDGSSNRYIAGFYADRKFRYEAAPSEVEYTQRITGNSGIQSYIGGRIDPWDVQPGKWLFYPDFLVGRSFPGGINLLRDPRTIFIESVRYTSPYGLQVSGGKYSELDQFLARVGLYGVAV